MAAEECTAAEGPCSLKKSPKHTAARKPAPKYVQPHCVEATADKDDPAANGPDGAGF